MILNAEKIVQDTIDVFFNSEIQKRNFLRIKEYLDEEQYKSIHRSFLTPLNIKINKENFMKEIQEYSSNFQQWGNEHIGLPRYGIALVNQDGTLRNNDPINGSLYEWNKNNPDHPIIESDCRSITTVMTMSSLRPLDIFNGHWCRSNILKWDRSAEFKPHIDTIIPSPWIRLWATFDKDIELEYYDGKSTNSVTDIEEGRLYLIDTSQVHYAYAVNDQTYQLFLSVLPSAYEVIKENLNE